MKTNHKDIHDSKQIIHICMPVLFVFALLMLRLSKRKEDQLIIYYEIFPRYLRGVMRLSNISPTKLVSVLSFITGLSIQKIKHGDEVVDYPTLRLNAMQKVVTICNQLTPKIEQDVIISLMKSMIGEKPAIAYTLRYLAHYQIHLHLTPFFACAKSLEDGGKLLLVCDPGWPIEWFEIMKKNLNEIDFDFYAWPKWYSDIRSAALQFHLFWKLPVLSIKFLLQRGLTNKAKGKRHYKLITEFVDPGRFNRTPFDADYWVDDDKIKASDVLFFLTLEQSRILLRDGHKTEDIIKEVNAKGYDIVFLDDLSYGRETMRSLFRSYLNFLRSSIKGKNNTVLGEVLATFWREYLEFAPLFTHFRAKSLVYEIFPHGNTGWRMNSALITGLCRKYGIKNFGCQNRVIDSKQYEFSFDCHDVYFSWGPAWHTMLEEGMKFIDEVVETGCIHLDALLPVYWRYVDENITAGEGEKLKVVIFPTDMVESISVFSGAYYTLRYSLNFLENCAKLAEKYPDINFIVKLKDPEHYDLLLSQNKFRQLYENVSANFQLEKRVRCDYFDLMISCDIVIAIGYTTPGIEALLLGKRSIYYSELKDHGKAIKLIPGVVAENKDELDMLFERALKDHTTFAHDNAGFIRNIDPFCDGKSLERIISVLQKI
jgi:hypothetical protein